MLATALASVGSFLVEPAEPVERSSPWSAEPVESSGWSAEPVESSRWSAEPVESSGRSAEPVESSGRSAQPAERLHARPIVAVFGLARGCGTTMVARALAVELASRDPVNAAVVACESPSGGVRVATQAAARLARSIQDYPRAHARAVGRLCLVHADLMSVADGARYLAPLVLDAGSSYLGGVPASLADRTVVVTTPAAEPALARVAADCLSRVGPDPIVVVNRVTDAHATGRQDGAPTDPGSESMGPVAGAHAHHDGRRSPTSELAGRGSVHLGRGAITVPEARLGAQLALSGREPPGALGRAIVRLADGCRA